MREIRLKAAKHIHAQKKKDGTLPAEEVFKESDCDMADIVDGDVYYVGFTFRSALASHFANTGLKTAFADASHMDGKGSSTYGYNRPWPKHGPGRFHRLSSRHLRS